MLARCDGLSFERIAASISTFVVHKEEEEGRGVAYSREGALVERLI